MASVARSAAGAEGCVGVGEASLRETSRCNPWLIVDHSIRFGRSLPSYLRERPGKRGAAVAACVCEAPGFDHVRASARWKQTCRARGCLVRLGARAIVARCPRTRNSMGAPYHFDRKKEQAVRLPRPRHRASHFVRHGCNESSRSRP
jgi:hypothetical protein